MTGSSSPDEVAREIGIAVTQVVTRYDGSRDPCDLDFLLFKLHQLYRVLVVSSAPDAMLENLCHCFQLLQDIQEDPQTNRGYTPRIFSGGVGRPRFDITIEQLEHLLHIGLSCSSIASSLNVSLRTVRRRMSEYGLSVRALYTTISDAELDAAVDQIKVVSQLWISH